MLLTNYITWSSNSTIFVSIGILDLLMGVERVNYFFGGPRLQTGRTGANSGFLMLTSRAISLKLSSLPCSLFLPHSTIPCFPKVYLEVSLRDLEGKRSWLISESLVDGFFLQVVLALATLHPRNSVDFWIPPLSWLKRNFGLL